MTRRRIFGVSFVLAVIVLIALGAAGWHYSNVIKQESLVVDHSPDKLDMEVAAIEDGRVTLRVTSQAGAGGPWTKDGIWGLQWDGGYAQVGPILQIAPKDVVRPFTPLTGAPTVGQRVGLDSFAFPEDPRVAHGLAFREVSVPSPLGEFPAWRLDGERRTWTIFVHGRGANRGEALRMLPAVAKLGFPSLVITYRNDVEAPASPDGLYHFGDTEWEDLEAAVEYAVAQGADGVVLVGYSMGGGIVTSFLYQSPLAGQARGIILDAPVLSYSALIDFGAQRKGVPQPLTVLGKWVAGLRFGIDWTKRDYLRRANELAAPVLLFHGTSDDRVSIKTSDALAERRPDIVTYHRVAGATHVRSWNMNPAVYETAARTFLLGLFPGVTGR